MSVIDHHRLHEGFRTTQGTRASRHSREDRITPSLLQYDYLSLSRRASDIRFLIGSIDASTGSRALDLGFATSPYGQWIEARGYTVATADVDTESGADHIAPADATGLPDASFDLVLCTQVLEHVPDPRAVLTEIRRILKPGGWLVASVPHVWFYHPHPSDYWRFTQEGVVRLCDEGGFELVQLRAQGGSAVTLLQSINFLLYGLLGRAGAPLYGVLNVVGAAADRLVRNDLFATISHGPPEDRTRRVQPYIELVCSRRWNRQTSVLLSL